MTDESVVLTIEKLAGLGDGIGHEQGRRVFVPYTLPGDRVRARIVRETKDATYAVAEEILSPATGRIAPVCRHFAACGGCDLQHVNGEEYARFKLQTACEAVRKAGYDPACALPLMLLPAASRRRVELKAVNGRLGYYARQSHRLVEMTECKVLEPALEALVLRLKPMLEALPLNGIRINGVDGGYDVLLSSDAPASAALEDEAIVRVSLRTDSGVRTLFRRGPVTVTLAGVAVEVPPGAFLQASRQAQDAMVECVAAGVGDAEKILDLFAGIGTYSFALARHAEVTAIEGDAAMAEAMRNAASRHNVRLKAQARDLFRDPVRRFAGYDAVVVNPPRSGAKEQAEALAKSEIKTIVMVSCNPATFARDARVLKEGGYRLESVLPIDQFVYSAHLEMVAKFSK